MELVSAHSLGTKNVASEHRFFIASCHHFSLENSIKKCSMFVFSVLSVPLFLPLSGFLSLFLSFTPTLVRLKFASKAVWFAVSPHLSPIYTSWSTLTYSMTSSVDSGKQSPTITWNEVVSSFIEIFALPFRLHEIFMCTMCGPEMKFQFAWVGEKNRRNEWMCDKAITERLC